MKKAIRCVAFLAILGITIFTVYRVLEWKDTSGDYMSATTQLYATEDELIDLVFLGSSHGYCGIVPDELWGTYGYSAFNLSTSGQDKNATYHLLKELLKTQSPKVVCIDLWGLTYDGYGVEGNLHRNMLALDLSKNAIELIRDTVTDESEQMDYILRWPIVHTRYKELGKYDFIPYPLSEYGRGIEISYHKGYGVYSEEIVNCVEIGELTDTNRDWIEELYELSVAENFELILFVAPTAISLDGQKQVNAVAEFAKENGITFFDFNKRMVELGISTQNDFVDSTHMNFHGAKKMTNYLGAYIEKNMPLDDHRGDEAYYQWEHSFANYIRQQEKQELLNLTNFEDYTAKLRSMSNVTYVVALSGDYKASTLDMKAMIEQLGLPEEAYEEGGIYINDGGQYQLAVEKGSTEVYIHDLNKWESLKLWNTSLHNSNISILNDVMLNLEPQCTAFNGINIVVYDHVTQKVIDRKGYF